MKFHCNGNDVTKFAHLKEVSKCSFKGEDIFISSKNCLEGIEQENWNLEVLETKNTFLYLNFENHVLLYTSIQK